MVHISAVRRWWRARATILVEDDSGMSTVDELASGRADAAQIYDAASAERYRNDRRSLALRMRRHGVEVVDAAPEDLAPALADRYLAMKASGQL